MCALMAEHDATHSELASFGEELRREREIRGISLKEISDATKISKRFLEAIERNDHRTLPAPVFTRGFVREYARYLGLSAEEMVTRYNYAAAGDDRIEQSEHLERLVRPITPAEPKSIPRTRVDRNVVLLIVIVIALGLVTWWALRFKRDAREAALNSAGVALLMVWCGLPPRVKVNASSTTGDRKRDHERPCRSCRGLESECC